MVNCIHLGFIAFWNLLINFCSVLYIYIYIILSVRPWTMAKKFVRFFVILARHSTGSGIKVFCLSYIQSVFLDLFFNGLQITYIINSKE